MSSPLWILGLLPPLAACASIPSGRPITLKQNGWCLDQQWSADPDRLILYLCSGEKNQQFIWHEDSSGDFALLSSVLDERCLGLDTSDLDKSGEPKLESAVGFKPCDADDHLVRWRYLPGQEQLESASYPGFCLDYSDNHDYFIMYKCKVDSGMDDAGNQRITYVDNVNSIFQPGVPIHIQHYKGGLFDLWSGSCLDQNLDPDAKEELGLFKCDQAKPNQLFVWQKSSSGKLNELTSSIDGRCVTAASEEVGAKLKLETCSGASPLLSQWQYAPGVQQIRLRSSPYLCLGALKPGQPEVGIVGCALDPEPHFEVRDVGRKAVPERLPLEVKQGDWCVEHSFEGKPSRLTLASCSELSNQEFVWRPSGSLGFHHLVSGFNDQCLSVEITGEKKTHIRPDEWSPVTFEHCSWSSERQRWSYQAGPEQLRMTEWPDLCLHFDERKRYFAVSRCTLSGGGLFSGSGRVLQQFQFSEEPRAKPLESGLPIEVRLEQFGDSDKKMCLQRSAGQNSLEAAACSKDHATDQLFDWVGHPSWHFHHLRSLVDDRCVGASSSVAGALVTLTTCSEGDAKVRWVYSHSRGYLQLAENTSLCLEVETEKGSSEGQFFLTICQYDVHRNESGYALARPDEDLEFVPLGYKAIAEDTPLTMKQDDFCMSQPFGESYLRLSGCEDRNNQKFVWTVAPNDDSHWLVSHIDNRCLGVSDSQADDKGKPYRNAPLIFKECKNHDPLVQWVYSYGRKQLQMASWLYLCLEYDAKKKYFTTQSCAVSNGQLGGHWLEGNQAVSFDGVQTEVTPPEGSAHLEQSWALNAKLWPFSSTSGPGRFLSTSFAATAVALLSGLSAVVVLAALAARAWVRTRTRPNREESGLSYEDEEDGRSLLMVASEGRPLCNTP
mmetsp:Transcript_93500/g.204736  ORF Transcript_93500/g.204736 Transcript_93500/m.204736 type:complete len:891 (-) Transcript_93500:84-2756(-)